MPALVFKGREWTYGAFGDEVVAYANFFKGEGLAPGDPVLLDAPNCPEFLFTYLGVVRNAGIIVPVNPMYTLRELAFTAKDCGAKYLVIGAGVLAQHAFTEGQLAGELGVRVIVIDDDFRERVQAAAREDFDLVDDAGSVSTYLYTSGTTGLPKAAMLTHDNLVMNAAQCDTAFDMRRGDRLILALPLFHSFGFTAIALTALYAGACIVLLEGFQPQAFIQELVAQKVTILIGAPAMYTVLVNAGRQNVQFPDIRMVACGGAALPLDTIKGMQETLGLEVVEGYGLTEASPCSVFNPLYGVHKPGSIGLAFPLMEAKIVGADGGELPPGEPGELLLKGPNIMKGYYNRPEETAEAVAGGWLHTGDIAQTDEDGYIYIVDRIKDLIIVGGLNVYPREVEEVLYEHPKVCEAAVVGVRDWMLGEAPVAFVALKDPADKEEVDYEAIIDFLKPRLAQYKLPRRVTFVDALPRNSSGKVLKQELRDYRPG
jgi:long-chain acyl-CoA synthetase